MQFIIFYLFYLIIKIYFYTYIPFITINEIVNRDIISKTLFAKESSIIYLIKLAKYILVNLIDKDKIVCYYFN